MSDLRSVARDWRAWGFAAIVLVLGLLDALSPADVVLLGFLVVPIVGSIVLASPLWTGLLTLESVVLALLSTTVNHYPLPEISRRLAVLLLSGLVAAFLARQVRSTQAQLDSERRRFILLAENATDVVAHASVDGVIDWVSPSVTPLLGWDPGDMAGRSVFDFIHPDEVEAVLADQRKLMDSGALNYEARFRTASGGYRWIVSHVVLVRDESGAPVGRVGGWRDFESEHEARTAVEESEERYRLLAQNSSDVVVHVRGDSIVWISPSLTAMLGWSPDEWIGHPITEFWHPDDLPDMEAARARIESGEATVLRSRVLARDGTYHWQEFHAALHLDAGGGPDGMSASFRTVDAEVLAERELERRARFDDLTGVLTRNEAIDRLALVGRHVRRPGDRTAVLFIDVDAFKGINDAHGHGPGDAVLRAIAERLKASVRSGDAVARMGGDEFVVILEGINGIAEAEMVAEKMRSAIKAPIPTSAGEVETTISIGVTLIDPGEPVDEMIARADEAMFAAKRLGRDRVVSLAVPERSSGQRPGDYR